MNYNILKNEVFVNPYNFVQLGKEKGERDKNPTIDKKVSGKLHCRMITKTPLAVPDVETKKDKTIKTMLNNGREKTEKHPCYEFYSIGGKKAIPASSIRGMIRSLYETVSDSCMVTMADDEIITNRFVPKADELFTAGVLIKTGEEWALYKADKKYLLTNDYKYDNPNKVTKYEINVDKSGRKYINLDNNAVYSGDLVTIKKTKDGSRDRVMIMELSPSNNSIDAPKGKSVLVIGEPFMKKRFDSVFTIDKQVDSLDAKTIKTALNRLENVVDFYKNESINRTLGNRANNHSGYKNFKSEKENGIIPVWFRLDTNGNVIFSMAEIGRVAYSNSVNDFVGKRYSPCKSRDRRCPACQIFGMVKGEAAGSKIRFTDAYAKNFTSEKEVTLIELGSPRTGYYPFYALDGIAYDQSGASISGRKFYWHISKAANSNMSYFSKDKTCRNSSMELANPGSEFEFDIFFDDISEEQLKQLEWVVTLGENDENSSKMQKMGHGKPLGLGSVKIVVDYEIRREYGEKGYTIEKNNLPGKLDKPDAFSKDALEQISIIYDFHTMDKYTIRYPYVKNTMGKACKPNDYASHRWFTEYKKNLKHGKVPKFNYIGKGAPTLAAIATSDNNYRH